MYFYNIIQGKKENGEGLWLILINFEDFSHYMVHGVVWEMVRKTPMHKIWHLEFFFIAPGFRFADDFRFASEKSGLINYLLEQSFWNPYDSY